jgi:hypothetical protein
MRKVQPTALTSSQSAVQSTYQRQVKSRSLAQTAFKKERVSQELKDLGVSFWGLMMAESRELPYILHDDEHLKGVVYGHYEGGFAMMAATDRRALFVDKKPFFIKALEMAYELVGGVSYGKVGFLATVTLHTRMGDYKISTMNFTCARRFIDFIEERCLERKLEEQSTNYESW